MAAFRSSGNTAPPHPASVWLFVVVCMIGGPFGAYYLSSAFDRGKALAENGESVEAHVLSKRTEVSMGTAKISKEAKTTYYLNVSYRAPGSGTVRSNEVAVPASVFNTKNVDDLVIVVVNPDNPGIAAYPAHVTTRPPWIKYLLWTIGGAMTLVGAWIAYREYTGQSLTLGGKGNE